MSSAARQYPDDSIVVSGLDEIMAAFALFLSLSSAALGFQQVQAIVICGACGPCWSSKNPLRLRSHLGEMRISTNVAQMTFGQLIAHIMQTNLALCSGITAP